MSRRLLSLLLAMATALTLGGCGGQLEGVRLTIATGGTAGVYYQLGKALSGAWERDLGMPRPTVLPTAGSVDALGKLEAGEADLAFAAADAAVRAFDQQRPNRRLRALARMHDDFFHVIVRAEIPATRLADLRGLRIATGSAESGTRLIADRLLEQAKLSAADLRQSPTDLQDSIIALKRGELDGFFWSGGLPTPTVREAAASLSLRMIDLSDVLPGLLDKYSSVYGSATVPASTYGMHNGPITTLVVRNFLLTTEALAADTAAALTEGMFAARDDLIRANQVALSLDTRSAIETAPIDLHEGALRYYRGTKV
ncbi:TAXI family TRAP transporter solute-binding subunit [Crossiella sp. CA-258035]|uniref:TAXI family TRAP transporter solute-binding subunit n=1 Tax=Crossiella sp. CA-258035 TaxID=2981138 RepID=UPI0024BD2198|nr:TAXI family TRAP transporter solute-binding subunit [Crossiella sp. CA-258035]WHT21336.1 TAXI family TRAP transporter solute-binding subunit [Crossiella sp. CA-258035]